MRKRLTSEEVDILLTMRRNGATYAEIQEALDITPAAVSYQLQKAGLIDGNPTPVKAIGYVNPIAALLMPTGDWVDDAICSQTDPDAFFPDKGGTTKPAKGICSRCPAQADCLEFALANEERFGIWGGYSERDRRKLAKDPHAQATVLARLRGLPAPPLPTQQEATVPTITSPKASLEVPDYIAEMAELLIATEGHSDPLVRATRKIVVQAAIALDQAQAAAPVACRECGCTDDAACDGGCWWVEPDLCSSCSSDAGDEPTDVPAPASRQASTPSPASSPTTGEGTTTSSGRKSPAPSQATVLMNQYGITAKHVRHWAKDQSIGVPDRGPLSAELVQAYIDAHASDSDAA